MKCFYHSSDLDGHCSGALVSMSEPDCELIGINYGDEFPWDKINKDEKVYMVDFSLQPFNPKMLELNEACDLVWIDHHISELKEYDAWNANTNYQIKGTRRNGIGACQLVWEYLTENSLVNRTPKLPTFIKLLAEYDVWNHSDTRALPFQWGLRLEKNTYPENIELWKSLFDEERVKQVIERGALILEYQESYNEKYAKACSFDTELDGLKCIAINKGLTNSMLFKAVWNPEVYDAMLSFIWRKGKYTVSLYSDKEGIDVSVIAKNRGGGGHKGAAGFQCNELPFKLC